MLISFAVRPVPVLLGLSSFTGFFDTSGLGATVLSTSPGVGGGTGVVAGGGSVFVVVGVGSGTGVAEPDVAAAVGDGVTVASGPGSSG